MSEPVTLYAIDDLWDDPELVKATGRKTKHYYCIDDYEGGHWPYDQRIKRAHSMGCYGEDQIQFTPQDAIQAYIREQQERCKQSRANIVSAEKMLDQYAIGTNSKSGDGADDTKCEVTRSS